MKEPDPSPAGTPGHVEGRVGRYELVEALGKGAMGVVYHAQDPLLERDVALKVMLPQIAGEPEQKHRFEREARAAAKLVHPNVVTVFDFGYHTDGSPYIAMELLRGEDLLRTMRDGPPLPLETKISLIVQILDGLAHAHQAGIVHRDIKPANVFLTQDGAVKIMDFGVARLGTSAVTTTGTVVGTVEYMSPEQVRGDRVDGRSDLFSAACVLCELVSGRRPFEAESLVTILYKITHDEPVIELPPGEPHEALGHILRKGLARNPEDRYETATEFAHELRGYLRALLARPLPADTDEAGGPQPPWPPPTDEVPAAPRHEPHPTAPLLESSPTAPRLERPPIPARAESHPLDSILAEDQATPAPAAAAAPSRFSDPTPLFRLLREIYVNAKSGHLHFTHGEERRSLGWLNGHIVMGTTDVTGEHLGDVLVRYGWLRQDDLDRATQIVLGERKRLGAVLEELGLLPRERLTEVVGLHVREILFNVAGRDDGGFAFEETAADSIRGLSLAERIPPGPMILEATRRIQDPEVVRRGLGDIDGVLALSTHPLLRMQALDLTPTDGFLLSRIDGMLTAREVFQIIPLPTEEIERSLFGLLSAGTVEYVPREPRSRSPGSGSIPARRAADPASAPASKDPVSPLATRVEWSPPTTREPQTVAPPAAPAAAGGRDQPTTSVSQAAKDLEQERQRREQVEALRGQICDAYEGLATRNHFELLGLSREATPDETKQAYFRLARPFHPDTHHDPSLDDLKHMREEVFLRLREAYDILRNPESRARYEAMLGHRFNMPQGGQSSATRSGEAGSAEPPASEGDGSSRDPALAHAQAVESAQLSIRQAAKLLAEEKYWDAIQLLEPVLSVVDGQLKIKARLGLARAYMKNAKWLKRAEEQLHVVLEEDPRCVDGYVLLGHLYRAGNLPSRAQAMYRKALDLAPSHEEALRELTSLGRETNPLAPRNLLDKLLGRS